MPFLFHAQKKSIFDVGKKENSPIAGLMEAIWEVQKHMKTHEQVQQVSRHHPFRGRKNHSQKQQDPKIQEQLNLKCNYLRQKTSQIKSRSPRDIAKELKKIQSRKKVFEKSIKSALKSKQQDRVGEEDVLEQEETQRLVKKKHLEKGSPLTYLHINQNLDKDSSRPCFFSFPAQSQLPGPGAYNPKVAKRSKNHPDFNKTSTKRMNLENTDKTKDNKKDQSIMDRMNIYFSYKNQPSANFKETNKSGKNINLFETLFSNNRQNMVGREDSQEEELNESMIPGPGQYELDRKQQINRKNKQKTFITGVERLPDSQRQGPGPGSYTAKFPSTQEGGNDSIPFMSNSPRNIQFEHPSSKQEFWYTPLSDMGQILNRKKNPYTKTGFGSSENRFEKKLKEDQDSSDGDEEGEEYEGVVPDTQNTAISMNYTSKRELFPKKFSEQPGPGHYTQQNFPFSCQSERNPHLRIRYPKPKPAQSKFQSKEITVESTSKKKEVIHRYHPEELPPKMKPGPKFGSSVRKQEIRQEFDGYYDVKLSLLRNPQSFNRHYACY